MKLIQIFSFLFILFFLCGLVLGFKHGSFSNTEDLTAIYLTEVALVIILALLSFRYAMVLQHNHKLVVIRKQNQKHKTKTQLEHRNPIQIYMLCKLNDEKEEILFPLYDEVIIGKNMYMAQLAFPKEEHICDCHCKLLYINTLIYLEPMNPFCIIYVDHIQIEERVLLHQKDHIQIGSLDLEIMWKSDIVSTT